MAKGKKVDTKDLIKSVEAGEVQTDIMKNFGYKTSTQLKAAYMKALIDSGRVTPIKGGRGAGKKVKGKEVKVGKRGSIIIPAEMVAELGIGEKDQFAVRKTKAGMALIKI